MDQFIQSLSSPKCVDDVKSMSSQNEASDVVKTYLKSMKYFEKVYDFKFFLCQYSKSIVHKKN